jgi:hypothetical protein
VPDAPQLPPPADAKPKGTRLSRLFPYLRAHWKELLALTLAAIPVLFIALHRPTRQAAQQVLTLPGGDAASAPGSASSSDGAAADAGTAAAAGNLRNGYGVLKSLWAKANEHQREVLKAHPSMTTLPAAKPAPVKKPNTTQAHKPAPKAAPKPSAKPKAPPVVKKTLHVSPAPAPAANPISGLSQ